MFILARRERATVKTGDDVAVTIPCIRWLWRAACLPVLMLLVILEPLVTFVLAGLTLLGLLTTLFF
jgi:carbon starvation protein CstA